MIAIDIREIKVTSPLDYAMRKLEEDLRVNNPKVNEEKYIEYLEIAKDLIYLEEQGKIKLNFLDNQKEPLESHTIDFTLIQDAWEDAERENFLRILNRFDGILFVGDSEGNISVMGLLKDLYTETE